MSTEDNATSTAAAAAAKNDKTPNDQPSIVDFIRTPVDVSPSCKVSKSSTNYDMIINSLRSAANDNYICLALAFVLTGITLMVLGYIASTVWDLLTNWRRSMATTSLRAQKEPFQPSSASAGDDVRYRPKRPHMIPGEGVAESTLLGMRLNKLENRYALYNSAIKKHSVINKDPEAAKDVIDGRILSRSDDDYNYSAGPDPGSVMRLDEGASSQVQVELDQKFDIAKNGRT